MKTYAAIFVSLVIGHTAVAQEKVAPIARDSEAYASAPYSSVVPIPENLGIGANPDYRHASTAAEGYFRGWADVIDAQGRNALLQSAAAINFEEARRSRIENSLRGAEVYWQRREAYTARMADVHQQRRDHLTQPQKVRPTAQAVRLPVLDHPAAAIDWPALLTGAEHAAYRDLVERIAYRRTTSRNADPGDVAMLIHETEQLLSAFKSNIRELKPADYLEVKQFLQSIAAETRNSDV